MGKLTIVPDKNSESLAPKHLKTATRAWFDQICGEYELGNATPANFAAGGRELGHLRRGARFACRERIYFCE